MGRLAVAAAGLAVVAALGVVSVQAQGGLGLTPTLLDFGELGAGGTAVASLTIESGAATETTLEVSATGDQGSWFTVHSTATDALDGVDALTELRIGAGAQSVVHVRLSVPVAFEGTQTIEAGLQLVELTTDGQDVGLAVEVPMRAQVGGDLRIEGQIVSVEVPRSEPGEPVEVRARVRNSGNSVLVVEVDGLLAERGAIISSGSSRALVRVGQEQLMTLSLEGPSSPGDYEVTAVFTAGGVEIDRFVEQLAIGRDLPGVTAPADRGSEGRGTVVWAAVAVGLLALTGAVLVARREVGDRRADPPAAGPRPRKVRERRTPRRSRGPREGVGRHSAGAGEEAWSPRR